MTEILQRDVLVLNKHWMAIHICSVRRAFALLYQDLARVVTEQFQIHDFESWKDLSRYAEGNFVHTPTYRILAPEVILLRRYGKFPKHYVKFNRRNIYQRDHFTCQYCAEKLPREELTIDHIVPRSRGGKSTWTNVVLACVSCNTLKGNMILDKCDMELIHEPKEPHWSTLMRRSMAEKDHALWRKFIDIAYWNVSLEE